MSGRGAALAVLLLCACSRPAPPPAAAPAATPAALAAHSAEFRREVVQAAPGVWVAVGFGIANSILVEGTDGVVVVDAQATLETGRAVMAEFRKLTSKPVAALVYTHSHPDHTYGAAAFTGGAAVPVYAHAAVAATLDRLATAFQPVLTQRAVRMYGALLDDAEMVNVGIGPRLEVAAGSTLSIVRPTHTFADRLEATLAGVRFELVHAPGETDDQIFVWLPERKVLLPADNFYRAFPNLYTIRGTTYRDLRLWADALDRMRALAPEVLVPSHSRPLAGAEAIYGALTDYRDAIRYVHDQTVRRINAGETADQIAATLRLPAHLAASPYLQEFYGSARWSARSVFAGNLGWFDGNPANLDPLPPDEEARRFAALAGGPAALDRRIAEAAHAGEHQWVLQLTDRALRLDAGNAAARQARVAALRALGTAASNANARHWYLTAARELGEGLVVPRRLARPRPEMLREMPIGAFFESLAVNLRAEEALDVDTRVGFVFDDTGERYTLWVRRGVCEVRPLLLEPLDLEVHVSAQAFKEMLAELRHPALALARDFEVRRGSKIAFATFMRRFRPG